MTYDCQLIELPHQDTLAVRSRTTVQNLPEVLDRAYGAIMQYLGELGEQPAGPPYVGYFNMDMQDLDVELGFPVARPLPGKGEVQPSEMPTGKAASCVHTGPYGEIEPAYAALSQWMQQNGHQPSGAAYEIYLNDPEDTPPEQLQTYIIFPLK